MADEKGDGGKGRKRETGVVTTGGGKISVCTELERRAPTVTVPYGMAVSVPQGTEAVMTGGVCLGVVNDVGTLLARRGAAVFSGRCGDRFDPSVRKCRSSRSLICW